MKGYSAFAPMRNAVSGHRLRKPVWRSPEPKRKYGVAIIGARGHGHSNFCYQAKNHGVKNLAALDKGWLGCGNTRRNTQITRDSR